MVVRVTNAGPEEATLHVLPTAWFRNTWSWELDVPRPRLRGRTDGSVAIDHPFLGDLELLAGTGPDGVAPTALFCENETNSQRLFGVPSPTPYPKDGINDHVVQGRRPSTRTGTAPMPRSGTGSRSGRRQRSSCGCGCACGRSAPSRRGRRRSAPASTGSWPSAARRPTPSTPS
jgi:hypothetical protein